MEDALRMGAEAVRFVRTERSERAWAARLGTLYGELVPGGARLVGGPV